MYYRISQFVVTLLFFCCACQPKLPPAPVALLGPGPLASALMATDTLENYFTLVSAYDRQLQYRFFDDVAAEANYQTWLTKGILPWPFKVKRRLNGLLVETTLAVNARFPGLLPDSVFLVLTDDRPYGPGVFFTRNNAIFVPTNDANYETAFRLRQTLYHELFHLISRFNPTLRPAVYALANFTPAPDQMDFRALDSLPRLTNPDAPACNYLLQRGEDLYAPVLYVGSDPASTFSEALNYGYFKVARDSLNSTNNPPIINWRVTTQKLPPHRVKAAAEANSDYLIHPEEIIAEHFAAIFLNQPKSLRYPEECEALASLLRARASERKGVNPN